MAELVTMPRLGQSMEEGTIVQWFKREGDTIQQGEPLLEVMSDKANFEVKAEFSGTIRKILADTNDTVPVNQPIAIVGTPDETIPDELETSKYGDSVQALHAAHSAVPAAAAVEPKEAQRTVISPRARRLADERGVPVSALAGSGSGPGGRILERDVLTFLEGRQPGETGTGEPVRPRMTPLAARVAEDLGVDLDDLALGLPGSRVTAEAVRRRADLAPPVLTNADDLRVSQRIPMRGLRKMIADNVSRSRQSAPHVTLTTDVDMTSAVSLLPLLQDEVQRSHGVKVTYTDLIVRASARALREHLLCNAALVDDEILVYDERNIGVAVATESGLLVPVIRTADARPLGDIAAELREKISRCRDGRQNAMDLSGGTFTITNLGAFGVDTFDPIIVPPQSCILGIGRIADKVVAVQGEPAVRAMMNLCLSFDHRVLDGVPAAQFLQRVKALLEIPALILL